jgi:hypothetical protein
LKQAGLWSNGSAHCLAEGGAALLDSAELKWRTSMQQQNDNSIVAEAVRPFARQTARLVTQEELQKFGLETGVKNYQSVFTLTIDSPYER